jgi:hypothetical protein
MTLNRVWLAAAAATVLAGSLAMAGCASTDGNDDDAATEQVSVTGDESNKTVDSTSDDLGVTNYAAHGGGAHGAHGGFGHAGHGRGGYGHAGYGHGGFGHGRGHGRGWGHWGGWRRDHRWWW